MKKTYVNIEIISKIEDISINLTGVYQALDALQIATEYGPATAEAYSDGFYYLNNRLFEIKKSIDELLLNITVKQVE